MVPLRQFERLPVEKWFGRGMKNYPPKDGDFMVLESGSNYTGELGCNRAWTTMRNPAMTGPLNYYACPVGFLSCSSPHAVSTPIGYSVIVNDVSTLG